MPLSKRGARGYRCPVPERERFELSPSSPRKADPDLSFTVANLACSLPHLLGVPAKLLPPHLKPAPLPLPYSPLP